MIDAAAGYAYFGLDTSPAGVIKVAVGSGSSLPTRVGAVTLSSGEGGLSTASIDTAAGYVCFGTRQSTARAIKVALGSGSSAPTRLGALLLNSGEGYSYGSAIDAGNGNTYLGLAASPSKLVKMALGQRGHLKGTKFTMAEPGAVADLRFYSHAAGGNVRLAIYDDSEPKNLLWQSSIVGNTAATADLVVPVSSGSPASLTLQPGTYWAAWQTSVNTNAPSYTAGTSGDGFTLPMDFGSAPSTISSSAVTMTDERWTMYITYTSTAAVDAWEEY